MGFFARIHEKIRLARAARTAPAESDPVQEAQHSDYNSDTAPMHAHQHISMPAQQRFGTFSISFENDRKQGTYAQTIDAKEEDMLFCALMLLEYIGHEDETSVMRTCAMLAASAHLYHAKREERLTRDARALFAASELSGCLNRDFLQDTE